MYNFIHRYFGAAVMVISKLNNRKLNSLTVVAVTVTWAVNVRDQMFFKSNSIGVCYSGT